MSSKSKKLNSQTWSRVSGLSFASLPEEKAEILNLLARSLRDDLKFSLRSSMFSPSTLGVDSKKLLRSHLHDALSNLTTVSKRFVVVCHSAIRCTEVIKELRQIAQKHKIFKAFGKHMKLEEQVASFKRIDPELIVGTPDRLNKLFTKLGTSVENVAEVLIETSTKPLGLLSINDCRTALIDFLFTNTALVPVLDAGTAQILLF